MTVDVAWDCEVETGTCPPSMSDWIVKPREGAPWTGGTQGSGALGVASRTRALYEWVFENAGRDRLCAHAQSSAAGRLMTFLTRYDAADLFHTIVFDGGPGWAFMPWSCGIDDGLLGPRPDAQWSEPNPAGTIPTNIDCMISDTGTLETCGSTACRERRGDPALDQASNLLEASVSHFDDLYLSSVMGGRDTSPAWRQVPLWLGGAILADGERQGPGLTALGVSLEQGLCNPDEDSGDWRCTSWDLEEAAGADWGFEPRLADAPHATSGAPGAVNVLYERMTATCPL